MRIERIRYKDIEHLQNFTATKAFKSDFAGSAPAPFIGRYNYPNVHVGILSPQFSGDTSYYDSPRLWSSGRFSQDTITGFRYGLVNSRAKANVHNLGSRFITDVQEIGLARRPPEVEISLNQHPQLRPFNEHEITPFGPHADIIKSKITSNVKISPLLEKVFSDTDLKTSDGISSLYKAGFEESAISKALSVGAMGLSKSRRLVPTRWSITATDDTIAAGLLKKIRDYPVSDYLAYFGGGWGNNYLILFFSEHFRYELFELYLKYDTARNVAIGSGEENTPSAPLSSDTLLSSNFSHVAPKISYCTDYEDFIGRKNYAANTAGGYYACRLPILEKMHREHRQASALAVRFITSEYKMPLGVWVCREAARRALRQVAESFKSRSEMLRWSRDFIDKKFGFDINLILSKSRLLDTAAQSRLPDYS